MKESGIEEDPSQIISILAKMCEDQQEILIWQKDDGQEQRIIFKAHISAVEDDQQSLSLNTKDDQDFSFNPGTLYFYNEESLSIFKSEQISIQSNTLSIKLPIVLKFIDENEKSKIHNLINKVTSNPQDLSKDYLRAKGSEGVEEHSDIMRVKGEDGADIINDKVVLSLNQSQADQKLFETELSFVTLEEEDAQYEGQRATPRSKPPEGKMALIQLVDESKPQASYSVYDLSQGGMSFLIFSKDEFEVEQQVLIKAFDTNKFERPMEGVVRAIREADDMGIQYKVGLEFLPHS